MQDTTSVAPICDPPKMELPQMTERILLVLPPSPLIDCAKAALKTMVGLLYKTVVMPERARSRVSIGGWRAKSTRGLQLDRIGLTFGRWLLSGLSETLIRCLSMTTAVGGVPLHNVVLGHNWGETGAAQRSARIQN